MWALAVVEGNVASDARLAIANRQKDLAPMQRRLAMDAHNEKRKHKLKHSKQLNTMQRLWQQLMQLNKY